MRELSHKLKKDLFIVDTGDLHDVGISFLKNKKYFEDLLYNFSSFYRVMALAILPRRTAKSLIPSS